MHSENPKRAPPLAMLDLSTRTDWEEGQGGLGRTDFVLTAPNIVHRKYSSFVLATFSKASSFLQVAEAGFYCQ